MLGLYPGRVLEVVLERGREVGGTEDDPPAALLLPRSDKGVSRVSPPAPPPSLPTIGRSATCNPLALPPLEELPGLRVVLGVAQESLKISLVLLVNAIRR